ncbi:MAG: hypothetical protein D6776_04965, partial [Planctomycetota bacterium]
LVLIEASARLATSREAERARQREAGRRALELYARAAEASEPVFRAAARCGEAVATLRLRSLSAAEDGEAASRSGGVTALALRVARGEGVLDRSVRALDAALALWQHKADSALEILATEIEDAAPAPRGTLITEALVRAHALAAERRFGEAARALEPALLLEGGGGGPFVGRYVRWQIAWLEDESAGGEQLARRVEVVQRRLRPVYGGRRGRERMPALVRDPLEQARLWTAVGRALWRLGRHEDAIEALQRAYRLATREAGLEAQAPAVRPIVLTLGELFLAGAAASDDEQRRAEWGIRAARKLAALGRALAADGRPEAAAVLVDAAVAYTLAGYGTEAERALERAVAAGGTRDARWWRVRAVALDLGRARDAEVIEAYRDALKHGGSGDDLEPWRARAAELAARRAR